MPELSNDNRDQVLAGHGVPLSGRSRTCRVGKRRTPTTRAGLPSSWGRGSSGSPKKSTTIPTCAAGFGISRHVQPALVNALPQLAAAQTFSTLLTGMTPRAGPWPGLSATIFLGDRAEGIYRDVVGSSPSHHPPAGVRNAETNGSLKTLLTDLEKWERKPSKRSKRATGRGCWKISRRAPSPKNTRFDCGFTSRKRKASERYRRF